MTAQVCILTAGRGSRLGALTTVLNKALLPLNKRAAISHIIAAFPASTEFVVGLGFLGGQVRDYLELAHPDRCFRFVDVPNFDGPGSGPGLSLLACRSKITGPFYFVSCDTMWEGPAPPAGNVSWLGVAPLESRPAAYCNVQVDGCRVLELIDKQAVFGSQYRTFTGLCYIADTKRFWSALEMPRQVAGEHQISNGLDAIVRHGDMETRDITWTDVGDDAKYERAARRYEEFDFSKSNEALYVVEGRVVKFFADPAIVGQRVKRAALRPEAFPEVVARREQFYAYRFVPGHTMYAINSLELFDRFLHWLDREVWIPHQDGSKTMTALCRRFYFEKTRERVAAYRRKIADADAFTVVNGEEVAPLDDLLAAVPWADFDRGVPAFIHGDLQFDNVLYDPDAGRFVLLDWRQDFGGEVEFGDLYYDLAKLYGGIVLPYDYIKQNLLSYSVEGERVSFDFAQRYQSSAYALALEKFASARGFDASKIRLLVALIYLNMAPLHAAPFDRLLFALGRVRLAAELRARGSFA